MKVIYLTGCLGFIGFHVAKNLLESNHYVLGIDKETYAADLNRLEVLRKYSRFKYQKADICRLDRLIDCDYVINAAAETHVDNSIESSGVFLDSNVYGVHRLLELIKSKPKARRPILLHISTDEVYGDIDSGKHLETDILKPSNPYAASKAAADMLVLAWHRTYDINYILLRPTNNYGIGQYVEKFIPKAIKHLTLGKAITMHDQGLPWRNWLHVADTAGAVSCIIDAAVQNQTYNISGNLEARNITIARKLVKLFHNTDDTDKYFDFNETRPGQDIRYALDDSKLRSLGWFNQIDFDEVLPGIVGYYAKNFVW